MSLGNHRLGVWERNKMDVVREKPTIKFNFQSQEIFESLVGQVGSETSKNTNSPTVPFQKAFGPSSAMIFLAASMTPEYVVCPVRATTCKRVLMTSAGVTKEAAGIPAMAPAARRVSG